MLAMKEALVCKSIDKFDQKDLEKDSAQPSAPKPIEPINREESQKLPLAAMLVPNGLTSALGGPKPVPVPPKVSPLEINSPNLEADQKTLQTQEL